MAEKKGPRADSRAVDAREERHQFLPAPLMRSKMKMKMKMKMELNEMIRVM
jgi:hypothetical protein